MQKLYGCLHSILEFFIVAMLVVMVVTVTLQIITRYVFFYSLSWSEELSRYMFVWLIFLGAVLGIKDNMQIKIDIVHTLVKGALEKPYRFFQHLLSMGIVTVLAFGSIKMIELGTRQKSPAMHIPMSIVYFCIPLGLALMDMEFFIKIRELFKRGKGNPGERVSE